jgi:hypothetical protein
VTWQRPENQVQCQLDSGIGDSAIKDTWRSRKTCKLWGRRMPIDSADSTRLKTE